MTRGSLQERFDAKVSPEPNSGCWLWLGPISNDRGYGRFSFEGTLRKATHVALELDGRPRSEEGVFALHKCDNPFCANPAHLFWGSHAENIQDSVVKRRHGCTKKDHCKRGHEFTEANTRFYQGKRHCRKCAAEGAKKRWLPKSRLPRPLKTECKRGHPMTDGNLYFRANGTRLCRSCVLLGIKVRNAKRASRLGATK